MSWIKLDDRFPDHEKTLAAGPEAAWLFVSALCWSSRHETDGKIPAAVMNRLVDNGEQLAERLVEAAFVRRTKTGFSIVNYTKRQRSRAEIEDERAKGRGRVAAHRSRRRNALQTTGNGKVRATDTEAEAELETENHHHQSVGQQQHAGPVENPEPTDDESIRQTERNVLERIADQRLDQANGVKNRTRYRAKVLAALPDEVDLGRLRMLVVTHPGAPIDALAGALLGEPNSLHQHRLVKAP